MKKIIARLFGGLGNQLFIYAAARRLALANRAELVLDDVSGFTRDTDYRRGYQLGHFAIGCRTATAAERMEPFSRLRRGLKRFWNARQPFERRHYLVQQGVDFDPRLLDFKAQGTVYLEGYWQSQKYFEDVEAILRQDLQIRQPPEAANHAMAEKILISKAVAVHVRFFDPCHANGTNNTPLEYYGRAIALMERLVPGAHYFLFSNHAEAARPRIPLPDSRITQVAHNLGDENAYADFWLMRQCQHFIIANSTFSWWGAWLGTKPGKIVIAPGFEKRSGITWWGFDGLLPETWLRL